MTDQERGLLPVRAALRPDGLYLALRDVAPEELRDAFMQETVTRVRAADNVVCIARDDVGKADPRTAPAGIVFHVARCGSTLVSQVLKQLDDLVVYAEPLPVNELLLPPHAWPRAELLAALRSLGDAFARHARKPYVLKLSSWNTLFCDVVAEAFPATPWVLCLRDPVEVAVSLLRKPPGWMRSLDGATELVRHIDPDRAAGSPEEMAARVLGAFHSAAGRLEPARGRLVQYDALPAAAWETVAPHFFGHAPGAGQLQRMRQVAQLDSKSPLGRPVVFAGDASTKQSAASAALRQAVAEYALPPLQQLLRVHASGPNFRQ